MDALMLLCRPGFEADCAAELASLDFVGYARAVANSGYLHWHSADIAAIDLRRLIFPRTGFRQTSEFSQLSESDRLTPLMAAIEPLGTFAELRLEYADTNEGRGLQRFLKRFRGSLEHALKQQRVVTGNGQRILHIFFHDSCNGVIGVSSDGEAGPWELGIPRLRLSGAAPSRSAQKIEEAWLKLMTEAERSHWLREGRTGVDLGAAPGGWTWQLARHGIKMTGVDHGKLAQSLMDEYPVQHVSADAYTYRPPKTVDWLVCDVVDKPARTEACMEKWLVNGWARMALFNLKLPMKQRFATVQTLLQRLETALGDRKVIIRAAQLYYDREEITVVVMPVERA
ncbi:MAG: 23S rRNA (cytidine(2498)-2'-O)-methyltransferase RlmM [Alcanivoracaceae bacterium]|nr:23S rRNA (cytidine(2498)-2'-O)-methyltransferase RlmM [Alcanivoracaceae bacterium]